ncbi:MFS transporter [Patiriisocius hiemis]|uniref:MFS transporter n=1 Tax=Patiriisocius hiemis TaxID=3075604 RepID=A0ABU2YFA9_9FLAO|nr:MFS transporter [Constantimarinum sp. W242]MDT0555733.1 MFS transporter [Constantimarinum sp. W242]
MSQFFCTSLWFAGNSVLENLIVNFQLSEGDIGNLSAAVQFGFIIGTLVYALLTIADRFSPSKVFFFSAILASSINLITLFPENTITTLLLIRFLTGFFLAGIYPVGMKIAADYYDSSLGKSLGFLVGALVLGTALPHFLQFTFVSFSWKWVIICTSILASLGGVLVYILIPDGPFRKKGKPLKVNVLFKVFKNKKFKIAAIGYFGHMWELYAFWFFIPIIIETYNYINFKEQPLSTSFWSFTVIAIGSVGCVVFGKLSSRFSTKKLATIALLTSTTCCLLSSVVFNLPKELFLIFLLIWGFFVIADSPLFSTLIAKNASQEVRGSALTIVNCIGFAITIISIQLLTHFLNQGFFMEKIAGTVYLIPTHLYSFLAVGPIIGLFYLFRNK